MARFTVNSHRFDPYKQFKFRVKWDGKFVAGVSEVSGLVRHTGVVEFRDGGEPNRLRKSPSLTIFEPIVLSRGITHDMEFEAWANMVSSLSVGAGSEVALKDFRKDIIIELLNEAGQVVLAYRVFRCWPSEYAAIDAMDANAPDVAMESITLEHEGWERDASITEPVEPGASGAAMNVVKKSVQNKKRIVRKKK
jgi:phage tail-like protein